MAYTTMLTGTTELLVDAAIWNTYLRDNMNHVYTRPGEKFLMPAVEWDGSAYYATPITAYNNRVAVSQRPVGTGQYVFFSWRVPDNFASLTKLEIKWIPSVTFAPTLECIASYGADGEAHNAHTGTLSASPGTQTAGNFNTWDISSAYPNMAAGDNCSARIRPTGSWSGNFGAFGLFFKYAWT